MNQEDVIKKIMAEVMQRLNDDAPTSTAPSAAPAASGSTVTAAQYPLSDKIPERIKSVTGKVLSDFTLAKVLSGELTADDFRISPETLELQAQVADSVNRPQLAANMRRASELVKVPDEELLAAYDALRPYRKSKQELLDLADELETKYGCVQNAAFIREAAEVYEKRGRLKREDD